MNRSDQKNRNTIRVPPPSPEIHGQSDPPGNITYLALNNAQDNPLYRRHVNNQTRNLSPRESNTKNRTTYDLGPYDEGKNRSTKRNQRGGKRKTKRRKKKKIKRKRKTAKKRRSINKRKTKRKRQKRKK